MNIESTFKSIIENTKNEIEKLEKDSKDLLEKSINQIENDWNNTLDKFVIKANFVIKSSSDDKNIRGIKAVEFAKRKCRIITRKLANSSCTAEERIELRKKLDSLNKFIMSYDEAYLKKENAIKQAKEQVSYNNFEKILLAKKAVEQLIDEINNKKQEIASALNTDKLSNSNNDELENMKNNIEEIMRLNNMKIAFENLLNDNKNLNVENFFDEINNIINTHDSVAKKENNVTPEESNEDYSLENKVSEVEYYFDIAKNNKNKKALDYAISLIEKIEDENIRNDLQANSAQINEEISGLSLQEKQAQDLVNQAQKTEKAIDFKNAYNAVKELEDGYVKDDLFEIIKQIMENNQSKFEKLLSKIENDLANDFKPEEEKMLELKDRYQYLPDDYINKKQDNIEELTIEEKYNNVLTTYNNFVQDEYQNKLTAKDFKKYSLSTRIKEALGGIVTFVAGTKIAKNFNKKMIAKNQHLLEEETDEQKRSILKDKIKKYEKRISDSDIIGGVRLFCSRNRLANEKCKIYQSDSINLNKYGNLYESRAIKKISKILRKGLNKKLNDETIIESKKRVINILDQYLELISSGIYNEDDVTDSFDYLESVKDVLEPNEYLGYYEEINIINDYRRNNNGIPYHMNNDNGEFEVDNVIKYFDSEESNIIRPSRYLKRK